MRAIHNTPIPDDSGEFPIPDDCSCDGGAILCAPCRKVIADDLARQREERAWLNRVQCWECGEVPISGACPHGCDDDPKRK